MNRKPSRTFLYLAIVMVFLLVVGLIMVGVLISNQNNGFTEVCFACPAILETNSAISTQAVATQTWLFYFGETATNLRGFEPSIDYLQTHEAERQTEVFNVEASLGATEAAKYWASETAFSTSISLTIDQMFTEATILAQTSTP